MNKLINKGIEYINQYRGWRSDQKIVVFESDDWGAIRTSSNEALEDLRNVGVEVDRCHYMLNDCLESVEDLNSLFGILEKYTDRDGNHPVFTFNTIVGNPDFKKIEESNYEKYYYKSFLDSYATGDSKRIMACWEDGIKKGLIYPQFHGREHVNIQRWMNDLKNGREDTLVAFNHKMFGISGHIVKEKRPSYLAVFDEKAYDHDEVEAYNSEGISIFRKVFGFSPKTFIAPNYVWNALVEDSARKNGIICMQGSSTQILPVRMNKNRGVVKNYLGKTSNSGIGYLIRNVVFEPSSDLNKDWVASALKQVENAFKNKTPAIIDSHRVNYVGTLNPNNRERSLDLLDELIYSINKKWPEVKFLHSEKLANTIYEA